MARRLVLVSAVALLLAGCSGTGPRDHPCMTPSQSSMRWGYYPGYGCGPVPPGQTIFP